MNPLFRIVIKDGLAMLVLDEGHRISSIYSTQLNQTEVMERMRRMMEQMNAAVRCRQNAVVETCAKLARPNMDKVRIRTLKETV